MYVTVCNVYMPRMTRTIQRLSHQERRYIPRIQGHWYS